MSNDPQCDRRIHAKIMSRRLREMVDHLRDGIPKVEEAQLKLMLETAAEMLVGLNNVFQNYVHKGEPAGQSVTILRIFDRIGVPGARARNEISLNLATLTEEGP